MTDEQPKQAWTPNRERKVRSKKSFDQERMSNLLDEDKPVYRGELDPRKKEEEQGRAAARKAKADPDYARTDESSDFRDRFEPCKASPARLGALFVTQAVRRRAAYAQDLIESTIDRSHMSAADRAFATLLILGVVSTWGTLDEIINRCLENPRDIKPDVRDAVRISTYEIIFLGKAPHAALDQGVELVRAVAPSATRLGNAVLHRVLALKDEFPFGDPTKDLEALARRYAFPTWLARKLIEDIGAKDACALMAASSDPAPLFIYVNPLKATDSEVEAVFAELGCELSPGEAAGVVPAGCYRISIPRALADGRVRQLFATGKILVSDASAQAIAQLVCENGVPETILEVGAGRGTKTIMLQGAAFRACGKQTSLTTIDSHEFKSDLLADRAKAYGVKVERTLTGNATRLSRFVEGRTFDCIFIDAPCSGLGTLRRHQEIRWRVTPEQITELADTGLALLQSAAGHVKPGGQIVYSTCTVTYDENIGVVKRFLESDAGKSFELAPIGGKSGFSARMSSGTPDAHNAFRFVKRA